MRMSEIAKLSSIPITAEYLAGGAHVKELERRLSQYYGLPYVLATSNATSAILSLCLALDLRGEQFVTTALTYGATIAGPMLLQNEPVFADVDPTLCLDPKAVAAAIEKQPDIRLILSADLFGVPADDNALRDLADAHGIWLICDASQSFGALRGDRPASCEADAIVLSFTYGKTLFAGEGGAIVTRHREIYDRLVYWSQHPLRQKRELGAVPVNEFGLNARMHPDAARRACAVFDNSLAALRAKQATCMEMLDILQSETSAALPDYRSAGVLPAFFRSIGFQGTTDDCLQVSDALSRQRFDARVSNFPLKPLYQHDAYLALYGHRGNSACPIAENISKHGFCLEIGETRTRT